MTSSTQVCAGCLSSDRKLTRLGQHFTLFRNIVEQNAPKAVEEPDKLLVDAQFCWECRQNVLNIQKFLTKVTRTQKILKRFHGSKLAVFKSFSGLKIINPDEKKIKQEVTVLNNFIEVPIIDGHGSNEENKLNIQTSNFKDKNTDLTSDSHENTYLELPDDDDDWADNNPNDEWDQEDDKPIESLKKIKNEPEENTIEIKKEKPFHFLNLKDLLNRKSSAPKLNLKEVDMPSVNSMDGKVSGSLTKRKICTRIPIGDRERATLLRLERMSEEYRNFKYKCKSCVIGFTHELTYVKHQKLFHNAANLHVCDICESRFHSTVALKLHKQTHFYKYRCNFCYVSERQQTRIYRHYEMVHHGQAKKDNVKSRPYKLPHLIVTKKSPLETKQYQCNECTQKCFNKASLARHIARNHGNLKCDHCRARFVSRQKLSTHVQSQHSAAYREQCYCVECDQQFINLEGYRKHIKESVKHNPEKKVELTCEQCNAQYQSKGGYKLHMRVHHSKDSHPFKCDICEKSFPFLSRLLSHKEAIHHNTDKQPKPKDKLCPHCGRGFIRTCHLIHHIRTHTGEKPYYCAVCHSTYNQKATLVSHYKSAHKVKLMYKQIKGYGELLVDITKCADVSN